MKKVVLIGAGNVSTSLAFAFANAGWNIVQVYSRSLRNAEVLSCKYNAIPINSLEDIDECADLYIIAVSDNSISKIADNLRNVDGIVVHSSGSTPLSVLANVKSKGIGVFYPFQTFSKSQLVDLKGVPIFIEASSVDVLSFLLDVGREIGFSVNELTSEKRMLLHLSGVFANNFTNHILALTHRLTSENGIDFKILQPLVEETVRKAFAANPKDVQTGPAVRGDLNTIEMHSCLLKNFDEQLHKIYNELSLSIQKLSKQ